MAAARARAREWSGEQHAELHGRAFPPARTAGRELDVLVIDLDASIVICHSEKELAAPTFKRTFGYHPPTAFCDSTSEFIAGVLCRGNAGANTAADHITVLDHALALALAQTSTATTARSWSALVRADTPAARRASALTSETGRTS